MDAMGVGPPRAPLPARGLISRCWRGELSARKVFWQGMVLFGLPLNLLVFFINLMAIAQDAPQSVVGALHFAALPYNLLVFTGFWRAADRGPILSGLAIAWLVFVILV